MAPWAFYFQHSFCMEEATKRAWKSGGQGRGGSLEMLQERNSWTSGLLLESKPQCLSKGGIKQNNDPTVWVSVRGQAQS